MDKKLVIGLGRVSARRGQQARGDRRNVPICTSLSVFLRDAADACADRCQGQTGQSVVMAVTLPLTCVTQQAASHKYQSSMQAILHILHSEGLQGDYCSRDGGKS